MTSGTWNGEVQKTTQLQLKKNLNGCLLYEKKALDRKHEVVTVCHMSKYAHLATLRHVGFAQDSIAV